jgi:hypothetical protein
MLDKSQAPWYNKYNKSKGDNHHDQEAAFQEGRKEESAESPPRCKRYLQELQAGQESKQRSV